MRRAWVALLISPLGCGFSASNSGKDAGSGSNVDAGPPDAAVQTCWKFADPEDGTDWSACTFKGVGGPLDLAADKAIDTDATTDCVVIETDVMTSMKTRTEVCALFASSIKIEPGITLSAHGSLPLALFAPTIEVQGTIDVASHIVGGQRGASSNVEGCNPSMTVAKAAGGGAGGTWTITGGIGGDQGGAAATGGLRGNAIAATLLRGGCDGRRGGDGSTNGGPDGGGGLGGGAVWLATNDGTLTIGATAVINASGASGAGAPAGGRGGSGGGSGGLIILQSKTINQDALAKIFANGGHGGGGSSTGTAGKDGSDPTSPRSTGSDGSGGDDAGTGGQGYPASSNLAGQSGGSTSGGGGGGGGGGVIRVATDSSLSNTSFSPNPKVVGR